MKISKADESSLLIALTEGLQAAHVLYFGYVSMGNDWEESLSSALDEDFAKRLQGSLDDGGLESLIQREVISELYRNNLDLPDKDEKKRLTQYKPFSDPLKIARRLVDRIKSFPDQYEAIVRACNPLAETYATPDTCLKISDRMHLVSGAKLSSDFVVSCGDERLDKHYSTFQSRDPSFREIDPSALYFVYRTSGYISDKTKPKPLSDFYDDLRAFYGACISFGLFYSFASPKHRSPVAVLVNSLHTDGRRFEHCEVADTDIVDSAALLTKKRLDEMMGAGYSLSQIFETVIRLFNASETQRLRTAAIWLLRAHRARGMDQILDSTIAIEVLLGDREASDRIGLSKLMANRCAYSLGKSAQERKELFDFFTKFYKVRSDIVHSGRMKLSESEAEIVGKGTRLASRILQHETEIS